MLPILLGHSGLAGVATSSNLNSAAHRFGQAKPFDILALPSLKSGSRSRGPGPQLCEERNDV
ncbi:MAG: hypothetical protein ACXWK3_04870 [Reyranella sp.]